MCAWYLCYCIKTHTKRINWTLNNVTPYLTAWELVGLEWGCLEEVSTLNDLQSLVNVMTILLDLVHKRLKLGNCRVTLVDELVNTERVPVEPLGAGSDDATQGTHVILKEGGLKVVKNFQGLLFPIFSQEKKT